MEGEEAGAVTDEASEKGGWKLGRKCGRSKAVVLSLMWSMAHSPHLSLLLSHSF